MTIHQLRKALQCSNASSAALLVAVALLAGCPLDPCLSLRPIEPFDDYDATLGAWTEELSAIPPLDVDDDGVPDFPLLVAGECTAEELRFVFQWPGFTTLTHYFDAPSGEFVALTTTTDVLFPCPNGHYWPIRIQCGDPVVTDVLFGSWYHVGDHIDLPGSGAVGGNLP